MNSEPIADPLNLHKQHCLADEETRRRGAGRRPENLRDEEASRSPSDTAEASGPTSGNPRGGGRGGGGGGGGGAGREGRAEQPDGDSGGRRQKSGQSPLLTRLEVVRRFSGLFFGLYVFSHLLHQAAAAGGPGNYDALRSVLQSIALQNPLLETLFVWGPLAVHLGSDIAFRCCGGKKGGGVRRRFSFFSGYILLLLVLAHVWHTQVVAADVTFDFAGLAGEVSKEGLLSILFLTALGAAALVHMAAGSINVVHQVKSLDHRLRDRLDLVVMAAAALLFVAVCVGLAALHNAGG